MLYRREKYLKKIRPFYNDEDIIKVITGVRRCGKSSLMKTICEEVTENGIKKDDIIYLDLDRIEYRKIKEADQLEKLILSFSKTDEKKYLFIDEVQNVNGFEDVVNGFRTSGGYSIFITGSNSYLLSGELVTKLTGRYIEFEMFPLSFDEYVGMKKFYDKPVSNNINAELAAFITEGGFPRTVLIDDINAKRTYINGVVTEIFDKDIRRRVKVKDVESFETVRKYIINNFGATTSISRLTEALRNDGINITRETVTKYINILKDAKILYECDRFDMKSKRSLTGEKKYYLADLGFYYSQNTDNRINYGPVLENIFFIYSRSLDYSVSVGRIGKLECDFILRNAVNNYAYVQIAYTIMQSIETEDREFRPLEKIHDQYDKYVLTTDYILQQRNGIKHLNMIELMIGGNLF